MKIHPITILRRSGCSLLAASGVTLLGWLPTVLLAADFPTDLLPPPTGTLDATAPLAFGTTPVQFRDFSLRLPGVSIAPPPPGSSASVQFSATVHARASNNNGDTFQFVTAPAVCTMSLTSSADGSGCDVEITELSVSGGSLPPAVRLRESPTLQSLGRFSVVRCPDGSCRIDSFFDIFTELSTNFGQSWTPSSGPAACVCRAPSCESPCADVQLPPVGSVHRSAAGLSFPNNVRLRSLALATPLTPSEAPVPGAPPQQVVTQVTCTGEISLDGGATFQFFECPAGLTLQVSNRASAPQVQVFDTEMLALTLSGGTLPGPVMVRESPTKASLGRCSVRAASDGSQRISSFFDIFTEVSLDAGQSWSPASNACVCALGDDRFFATDCFPCPADYAAASDETLTFGTTGLVIRKFQHRPSAGRSPLPGLDVSETRSLDGEVSCEVSTDGGLSFTHARADCLSSASVTDVGASSGTKVLEVSALTCALATGSSGGGAAGGGASPVLLRESPTKGSTLNVRVCTCPSGYYVSSFFDIFTEVSLDGGASWVPADSSLRLSLLPYVEQDNVFASAYALPRDGVLQTHRDDPPLACRALTKVYLARKLNVLLQSNASRNPLYEDKGGGTTNPLFAECSCEVSDDNGVTWTPATGTATGSVTVSRVTFDDAWDQQTLFDTEMSSLSVQLSTGGTLSFRLRESPSKPSLGRIAVQRLADGSACRMDSFFDVFTELSFDDGATWSPCASAARLELHAVPDECFVLSPRLPLALPITAPDAEYKTVKRTGHVTIMTMSMNFSDFPAGGQPRLMPPAPGSSVVCDSTVPVSFEYSPDGVAAPVPVECDAAVSCRYTGEADGSLSCEMLSCVFSGGSLPSDLRVRESPTRASLGRVSLRECPGGYCVSSFFDIFTEISTDGGATYEPACSPLRLESRALSPRLALATSPAAVFLSRLASQTVELRPRQRIGSCVVRCAPGSPVVLPPAGSSSVRIDTGTIDFLHCPEGSTTFTRLHGDVFLRYEMKEVMVSSYSTRYDTEMLQFEVSGLPSGMRLRESPTLPSRGQTRVHPQADGSCRVSSFFDIFTELSVDGGRTWEALDLPLHHAFEEAVAASGSPVASWPPPGQFQRAHGDLASPAVFSNGRVLSFFDIFTELSATSPALPPAGATLESTCAGTCRVGLGGGPGDIDQDCDIQFTTRLTATGTFSDGTTCYDTEMLALSLSSSSGLPLPFMIRESPTRASLGQTRCRVGAAGGGAGGCVVDSFFDIFTELSLDGGATWSPCDAPVRVAFVSPEIEVSTPDGAAIADGGTVTVNANIASTVIIDVAGFVVRNGGSGDLTGLDVSIYGPGATSFSITSPPDSTIPPGGSTAFKVGFASSTAGTKQATLHITCNDADEPSFDITLSARALFRDADDDVDGISNGDELALAGCGFDPLADSSAETDVLRDSGFFRASDMHAMALGPVVLDRNPATGRFQLRLDLRQSSTLSGWQPLTGFSSSVDPDTGRIDLDIAPSSSKTRFFQVLGQVPSP